MTETHIETVRQTVRERLTEKQSVRLTETQRERETG